MAHHGVPVGILPSRPSGYALLLRVLTVPGHDVLAVTVLQHLAGLAGGGLVYGLLVAMGVRRLWAAAACAVVALDADAIALEQFIMADAVFTGLVLAAVALSVMRRRSPRALLVAGLLLAAACTVRTTGLFVIPVWLGYLVWTGRNRRRLLLAAVGLFVPLLGYAAWHASQTGGSFGLDQANGWFLYGRVAGFADCRGADVPPSTFALCAFPAEWRPFFSPGLWVWGVDSPAVRLFGGTPDRYADQSAGEAMTARNNRLLERFAVAIIGAHPGAYARAVVTDFLRFFDPRAGPFTDADGVTVTFPGAPLTTWVYRGPRDRYLRGYRPQVRWPASLLRAYQKVFHTPRLVLGLLVLAALTALLAPFASGGRLRPSHQPEILLLTGSGLAMLLGSAAFVGFVVRYLIPAVPLLMAGGVLASHEIVRAIETARRHDVEAGARSAIVF
jgi:hypothetical protein